MTWRNRALAAVAAGLVSTGALAAPVTTQSGQVEGVVEGGLTVYKGIPFAAPPVGDLRWKPPQPAAPWQGVLKADKFAPACMQRAMGPGPKPSEDCLYLNIWTPAKKPDAKLAVIVWIHGGGFSAGSPSMAFYWGDQLANKGVVVVNIAYRLGPFGFLAYPGLTAESPNHASGNYGLMDQIAALKWVKRNIAGFGGDPGKVTIFGESAGAQAVDYLTLSPLSRGLYRAAIADSGGAFNPPTLSLDAAEKLGEIYATSLGAKSLADLRAMPAKSLVGGDQDNGGKSARPVGWPIVDGYVIAAQPHAIIAEGRQVDVPILIGSNAHEGRAFTMGKKVSRGDFVKSVKDRYGAFADSILKAYPAKTDEQATDSNSELTGDVEIAWSMWAWANAQAKTGKSKVYYYEFEHAPPAIPGNPFGAMGATHGSEVAYVFGHANKTWTDYDHKLSNEMSTYWTNFATSLNPNGSGLHHWPAYTPSSGKVMHFGDKITVGPVRRKARFEVLDKYFAAKWAGAH